MAVGMTGTRIMLSKIMRFNCSRDDLFISVLWGEGGKEYLYSIISGAFEHLKVNPIQLQLGGWSSRT